MKKIALLVLTLFLVQSVPAFADSDSSQEVAQALASMKQEMRKMQDLIQAQNARIAELESSQKTEIQAVPAAPIQASLSEADWQKGIKDNIGEAVPWLKGAKFSGDFRLRMENFDTYNKNNDAGSTGTVNDRSRNRFRVRLRWGFEKDFGDDWKTGFRLVTGSATDPNSTNVTLGNPGYFTYKAVFVDRAYASYEPNGLKDYGVLKGVKISGGKIENPFLRYSTSIVWDSDVTPEGFMEQANWKLLENENNRLSAQTTLGQFITNENAGLDLDAELFAYQQAFTLATYALNPDHTTDFTFAVSYYNYTNWSQTVLAANNTAATSYLRTNSLAADDFQVFDFYPEIVFYAKETPVTLWYDYAVNAGNEGTSNALSLGNNIHDADDAWGVGFKIGKTKKKGSWEASYGYYEIGANSVPAAFNDSDFGGPSTQGFTNRKGHKLGLGYMLTDSMTVNWTVYFVRPLNPFNGTAATGLQNATNESVFRSQLDAVYKF